MNSPLPSDGGSHVTSETPFPPLSPSSDKLPPVAAMMLKQGLARETSPSDSPYSRCSFSSASPLRGLDSKFFLPPDIGTWYGDMLDDYGDELHRPDDRDRRGIQHDGGFVSWRGLVNLGSLIFVCVGAVLLLLGYPVIVYFTSSRYGDNRGWGSVTTNATGQIPNIGNFGLIDKETPVDVYSIQSYKDGNEMVLVFSDEFNTDGRTFYPGDDPYWEAVDLHYWATNNLEWLDPGAVTTADGSLVITLSRKQNHGLNYQSAMIQTWNRFCFTGGYIEANVSLPGLADVSGLWPAIWTMGNLGRAGYGATLDGMWPYSYDSCDVGTAPNQTLNGLPEAAVITGKDASGGHLSYLPGQRLSRCTCDGESHPGPKHSDGTFVGRAAPEIDIFEAQTTGELGGGQVSQSAQWAPFNHGYIWENTTNTMYIADPAISSLNTFTGTSIQQASSVVTSTNQDCYEGGTGCFSVYGFEYNPGFDNAYISWVSNGKLAWTLLAAGMGPDPLVEISARPVSQEPMYIIINLGMSENFGTVDLDHLPFPTHLKVDYVRVYQPRGEENIGCEPQGFPTQSYINQYIDAYSNPNFTTWVDDYHQEVPRSRFLSQC